MEKPVLDNDQIVEQLTHWHGASNPYRWFESSIIYSIGSSAALRGTTEIGGLVAMTAAMETTAQISFELWDELVPIELDRNDSARSADISFNYSTRTDGGTYAAAWIVDGGRAAEDRFVDAEIWLAAQWYTHDQDRDLYQGSYGVATYLHEIGHALGLSHPGHYDGYATFSLDAEFAQDTRQYTVMSYFNAGENGNGADHTVGSIRYYAATPLLYDILALQSLYGVDRTTRSGDTIYGFTSNAGRDAFDFNINTAPVIAIWDAGGTDTLNASGFAHDQIIDLNEGRFSSIGALTQNVSIAYGAVIENAIGGSGNDILTGNAAANLLQGGGGDDILSGGAGADVFDMSGGGSDRIMDFSAEDALRVADAQAALSSARTGADGVMLSYSGGGVTLLGVDVQTLVADGETLRIGTPAEITAMQPGEIVTLAFSFAEILLTPVEGGFVLDIAGEEERVLSDIARLELTDTALRLDTSAESTSLYLLYELVLGRTGDLGGLTHGTAALRADASLTGMAAGFLDSIEFQNSHGDLSDAGFVDLLYRNGLNRNADTGGLDFWTDILASGSSRAEVATYFLDSPELQANFANETDDGIWLLA